MSPSLRLYLQPLYHKVLRAYSTSITTPSISKSTTAPFLTSPEKWDIYASLCIERKPIITPELTPIEKRYSEYLAEVEFETSFKSNHEMRHEKDKILLEKIKKGEVEVGTSGTIETAQDFEDTVTAEFLKFVPMSRTPEEATNKDTKSINRSLDSHLVLLINQILGSGTRWVCPQLQVGPGQTLRSTADQLLNLVTPNIKAKILGNAPFGYYKYKYPKDPKHQVKNIEGFPVTGAKVFFYKANYISGAVGIDDSLGGLGKDFAWVTRSELSGKLQPKYYKALSRFLVDEG